MITQEQTTLIRHGFGHMVDNGYSKIDTVEQAILALEVQLERARREKRISEVNHEFNPGADTVIDFLAPIVANLIARAGL